MSRAVEEWRGKTDDAKVPPHVRARIFLREGGRCHLSKRPIRPGDLWDLDHKRALWEGGEHRESNLFPALRDKHREKSAADRTRKGKEDRTRINHLGLKPRGRGWNTKLRRRMDGTVEVRRLPAESGR